MHIDKNSVDYSDYDLHLHVHETSEFGGTYLNV